MPVRDPAGWVAMVPGVTVTPDGELEEGPGAARLGSLLTRGRS